LFTSGFIVPNSPKPIPPATVRFSPVETNKPHLTPVKCEAIIPSITPKPIKRMPDSTVDIYNVDIAGTGENLTGGSFFSFKNLGDKIQGAFVRKSGLQKNHKYGHMEIIYTLKNREGLWWISIKQNEKSVHDAMSTVLPGMMVAITYVKDVPTQFGNDYKVKEVVVRRDLIDLDIAAGKVEVPEPTVVPDEPFPGAMPGQTPIVQTAPPVQARVAPPVQTAPPVSAPVTLDAESKERLIMSMAKSKFGPDVTKEQIMEKTNLVFMEKNFDLILATLQKF